jgi:hypothetical protein
MKTVGSRDSGINTYSNDIGALVCGNVSVVVGVVADTAVFQ